MRFRLWKPFAPSEQRRATWEEIEGFARAVWTKERGTIIEVPRHFTSQHLWLVNGMIEGWQERRYQLQADGWYEVS